MKYALVRSRYKTMYITKYGMGRLTQAKKFKNQEEIDERLKQMGWSEEDFEVLWVVVDFPETAPKVKGRFPVVSATQFRSDYFFDTGIDIAKLSIENPFQATPFERPFFEATYNLLKGSRSNLNSRIVLISKQDILEIPVRWGVYYDTTPFKSAIEYLLEKYGFDYEEHRFVKLRWEKGWDA